MSILNFLKKIKLPSFEDEFIIDPVDQEISPEHGQRMRVFVAMHREKVLADKTVQARQFELEESMEKEWDHHSDQLDPLTPSAAGYYDPWSHMNE